MITCQGRDHHIVNVQSGRQSLVIANVHFEPELTLRRLRERLRLITPHWLSYPNAVGIIPGDFNICELKKEGLTYGTKHSLMVTRERLQCFHFFFPNVLEIVQPDYTGGTPTALGIIRTLSRIDRIFYEPIYG